MTRNEIQTILATIYPAELVDSMLTSYENALREYKKGNWQYFGNEIGQFIEIARRIIEYTLDAAYTPLTEKLPIFSEKILTTYEHHNTSIPEVYRLIIPRILYAMYCLRNKRGMIHKSHIDPNKMDASVLLGNTKWILAEFFRQASTLSFEKTEEIIDSIICRETAIVWNIGSTMRILDTKMSAKDKVLCLLYIKDGQSATDLQNDVEYKNTSNFRMILRKLHNDKLIEFANDICKISPLGMKRAEELLSNY